MKSRDTTELAIPYQGTNIDTIQKIRDIFKLCTVKNDNKATYVLLGIENQSDIHYAMPIRNCLYDALAYTKQVNDITKIHKKE